MDQQEDLMRTLLACAMSMMEAGAAAALDAQARQMPRAHRRQIVTMMKVAADGAAYIIAAVNPALAEPSPTAFRRRRRSKRA